MSAVITNWDLSLSQADTIQEMAKFMLALRDDSPWSDVRGTFNGAPVSARSGDSEGDVVKRWGRSFALQEKLRTKPSTEELLDWIDAGMQVER